MAQAPAESPSAQLKPDAIGFVDALVIGLASTSPAYSLAAVIGGIAVAAGSGAPGILLASFVPMMLIATAFLYLNRVDQDCGTTFSWTTRALGPWFGWVAGWSIAMTGVLVIGSLADVGARFGLYTIGQDSWGDDARIRMPIAIGLILLLTWICVLGTALSARLQNILILGQIGALLAFAVVALYRAYDGNSPLDEMRPALEWLNPFAGGTEGLSAGLLLGVFAYWGWESAVNLSEETTDGASAPGRAGLWSTVILLVTYVSVAFAIVAFAGTQWLSDNAGEEEFVFAYLAGEVLGGWDWVLLFAVATSAIASTQTTIIPASRTGLSMARRHALPAGLSRIHPTHRTPDVSTWWVAGIAIIWYVLVYQLSENALFDSLSALALLIAFYYAMTGVACAVYYRKHLLESTQNLLLIGIGPLLGAGLLVWLLVLAVGDLSDPENSYSGQSWFGFGPPLVIGVGVFAVGIVVMLLWRTQDSRFWQERGRRRRPGHRPRPPGPPGRPRCRQAEGDLMAVVLGYDESPGADAALATAIAVAQRWGEVLILVYGHAAPGGLGEESRAHGDAIRELGQTALSHAVEKAQAAGIDTQIELVNAKPADALVQVGDAHDATVIVVGTAGESPLRGAMLGSTPHKLLHLANRPVLCVPPTTSD